MGKSLLSNALGQVGDVGKQIGQGLGQAAIDLAKTTPKQITGKQQKVGIEAETQLTQNPQDQNVQKSNEDFVEAIYAKSDSSSQQIASKIANENPGKSPEEIQKMAQVQEQLKHQQHTQSYFVPTFEQRQSKEEAQKIEEQREKHEEENKRWELQEKEKKEEEKKIALQRSQTRIEANRGVSG